MAGIKRINPAGTLPLFEPASDWKAPSLSDLPSWKGCRLVALDTEFKDATLGDLGIGARRGAKLAGYSFMLEGDRPYYVPLRHPGGGNVDCDNGLAYLRDNLGAHQGDLLGANMNVDLDILFYEGVRPDYSVCTARDIQVAQALIWELDHSYSYESIAKRYGVQGKDEGMLKEAAQCYGADVKKKDWRKIIPDLPCKFVGPYGEQDVRGLFPIYYEQLKIIQRDDLQEVWDLESTLLPILLKMRQRGVRIDFDHLDKVEAWSRAEETKTLAEVKRLTGVEIPVGSTMTAAIVARALIAAGHEPPLDTRGHFSVKAEFLATINHPVGKLIRYARQMDKIRTTFVASIRRYQTNGRIHCTSRQTVGASERNEKSGAAFGRISTVHPNLAQQPSRASYANFWRQIYIPEEGCHWASLDYSQQEPRWVTHFAALLNLTRGKEAAQAYWDNPQLDSHDGMAQLTGLKRTDAKQTLLARLYGQGGAKLCNTALKLPTRWRVKLEDRSVQYFGTYREAVQFRAGYRGKVDIHEVAGEEGQRIMDTFDAGAPYVKELNRMAMDKAEKTGVLKVLGGRKLHFPLKKDGSYDWSYKALNRIIQGTSAYQMKMALIEVDRSVPDFFLQLQVYDELDGSCASVKTMKQVAEIMSTIAPAKVPFRIDTEYGPNWGTLTLACNHRHCDRNAVSKDGAKPFYCEEHS
jgi:DNA polymerase I-like protein with 3'-5' exonuclease and polymerase domains